MRVSQEVAVTCVRRVDIGLREKPVHVDPGLVERILPVLHLTCAQARKLDPLDVREAEVQAQTAIISETEIRPDIHRLTPEVEAVVITNPHTAEGQIRASLAQPSSYPLAHEHRPISVRGSARRDFRGVREAPLIPLNLLG